MINKINMVVARVKKELTQKQLGQLIGKSGQYIYEVENNITTPSLESLITISKALGVTLDYLIEQTEKEGL